MSQNKVQTYFRSDRLSLAWPVSVTLQKQPGLAFVAWGNGNARINCLCTHMMTWSCLYTLSKQKRHRCFFYKSSTCHCTILYSEKNKATDLGFWRCYRKATSPVNSLNVLSPTQCDICKSCMPYVVVYVGALESKHSKPCKNKAQIGPFCACV